MKSQLEQGLGCKHRQQGDAMLLFLHLPFSSFGISRVPYLTHAGSDKWVVPRGVGAFDSFRIPSPSALTGTGKSLACCSARPGELTS